MKQYNFVFTQTTELPSTNIPTKPTSNIPSGISAASSGKQQQGFEGAAQGAIRRAGNYVAQQALAPLNTVTGGLATPVFNVVKGVATGAGAGAIGAAAVNIVIALVGRAVDKMNERLAKFEAQAEQLNNRDNLLIKSGRKTYASFYNSDVYGVHKTSRRD